MRPTPAARLLLAALALGASTAAVAQSKPAAARAPAAAPPQAAEAAPPAPAASPASAAAPAGRASVAATAAAPREEGDAARAMGTWALVVFNTRPFDFPNTGGATPLPLTVYTVGLRRWNGEPMGPFKGWGYDLGVGLAFTRSRVTQPQTGTLTTSDGPSTSGFGLHAGLPLALSLHRHALFELVPEADVIWASESIPPLAGGDKTTYGGWSARLGARAGFEVFFGFVGLPELAIEASMGAALTFDSVSSKVGPVERSTRQWGLSTQRGSEPWSVFTGSVAAMYHF
jgi:hypothetical protein